MAKIVELETDDGRVLSFEADEALGGTTGYEPASDGDTPLRRRFDEAFDDLRALAASLTAKLDAPDLRPDTLEIEVGVKMTAKAGGRFCQRRGRCHAVGQDDVEWPPRNHPDDTSSLFRHHGSGNTRPLVFS